jgi:hypothetical protein
MESEILWYSEITSTLAILNIFLVEAIMSDSLPSKWLEFPRFLAPPRGRKTCSKKKKKKLNTHCSQLLRLRQTSMDKFNVNEYILQDNQYCSSGSRRQPNTDDDPATTCSFIKVLLGVDTGTRYAHICFV